MVARAPPVIPTSDGADEFTGQQLSGGNNKAYTGYIAKTGDFDALFGNKPMFGLLPPERLCFRQSEAASFCPMAPAPYPRVVEEARRRRITAANIIISAAASLLTRGTYYYGAVTHSTITTAISPPSVFLYIFF